MGNQNQLPGGGNGFDALCQNPGILRAVPVGDGHDPVSCVQLLFGVHLGQRVNGLFPAPDLAAGDDMAVGGTVENGLDVQHRADHGGGPADPAAALQEIQVIHGEVLAHMGHFLIQQRRCLTGRGAHAAQLRCPDGQQTVAKAAAPGVHNVHKPVRELLFQLLLGQHGCLIGAADAGGHGDIHHILPLLQNGAEMGQKQVGVQQTGGDLTAVFQLIIIVVGIEAVHIPQVLLLNSLHGIGTGKQGNPLQLGRGQVGAAVRKHNK